MRSRPEELYGISISELARICHVSLKTAARWKAGTSCPPATALMIISADLGCFAPEWRGWTVNGPNLVSPDGWTISRNDALAVPLMHGQISALRSELGKERERNALEEQPQPDSWDIAIVG